MLRPTVRPLLRWRLLLLWLLLMGVQLTAALDTSTPAEGGTTSSTQSTRPHVSPDARMIQPNTTICQRRCQCSEMDAAAAAAAAAGAAVTVNCSMAGLKAAPLHYPPHVRILVLDSNRISILKTGSFIGLHNLSELSLKNNNISIIQEGAFRGLVSLLKLDLSSNSLGALPEMLFADTPMLATLHVQYNDITAGAINVTLPRLRNLETLDLAGTPFCFLNKSQDLWITALPIGFASLEKLQKLNLQDTGLRLLPGHFFQPLKDIPLEWLNLADNKLVEGADNTTFAPLRSLKYLDLSRTFMDSPTTENLFKGLHNSTIDVIYLMNVYIFDDADSILRSHTFRPLENTTVRVLHMENNYGGLRGEVTHKVFRHVHKLEELYLDACIIHSIEYQAFQKMDNLRVLSLRNNFLNCVTGCDFLTDTPKLPRLEILDLTENVITVLGKGRGVFDGHSFPHLRRLSLRSNRLHSLNKEVFVHLRKLDTLDLSLNPLVMLEPATFQAIPSLHALRLNDCILLQRLWNGTFRGLAKLRLLELEGNNLYHLDAGVFHGLDGLQKLSLRANKLRTLPAFLESSNLTTLDLGENQLEKIPTSILSNNVSSTVQILLLDHNRISSVDAVDFDEHLLPEVTFLDVSHNSISRVDVTLDSTLPALERINLAGNPFLCDCDLNASFAWLRKRRIEIIQTDRYVCSGDESDIFKFSASKWTCGAQEIVVPLACFILGVLVVLLVFSILWFCSRRRQQTAEPQENGDVKEKEASTAWCIPLTLRPMQGRHKLNGDVDTRAASERLLQAEADSQAETTA